MKSVNSIFESVVTTVFQKINWLIIDISVHCLNMNLYPRKKDS